MNCEDFIEFLDNVTDDDSEDFGIPEFVCTYVEDVTSIRRYSDNEVMGFELWGRYEDIEFTIDTHSTEIRLKNLEDGETLTMWIPEITMEFADYYFDLMDVEEEEF